jgi:hypothetical protein
MTKGIVGSYSTYTILMGIFLMPGADTREKEPGGRKDLLRELNKNLKWEIWMFMNQVGNGLKCMTSPTVEKIIRTNTCTQWKETV